MTTSFEPFDVPEIRVGKVLKKPIVVLNYRIIPGHTKPGGQIGHKEDYVKRHIDILIEFDGKEYKIKTDSLNFEKQLSKNQKKLPAETEIFGTRHGMWFSPFRRVRSKK